MATSASSSSPVNTDRTRPPFSTASAGTSFLATARRYARSGSGMVWAKDTARDGARDRDPVASAFRVPPCVPINQDGSEVFAVRGPDLGQTDIQHQFAEFSSLLRGILSC